MVVVEQSVEVSRPLAETFRYVADVAKSQHWDPGVVRSERLNPGPLGVGSRFVVEVPFGPYRIPMEYEIDAFEPHSRVVLSGTSASLTALDEIRFAPTGAGGTQITYRAQISFKRGGRWLQPALQAYMPRVVARALQGLVGALDGDARAGSTPSTWHTLQDRLVLPGLARFTRLGYSLASRRFAPIDEDLRGRTAVITGATSGLGKATALALARLGAHVVLVGRSATKCEDTHREVSAAAPHAQVELEVADLARLTEIRRLAARLLERHQSIHVLVNNAGSLFDERRLTDEGIERTLATNLLGHFVLTEALLPRLIASAPARVVNVSSGGMYTQKIQLEDLEFEHDYDGVTAYARTKRGQVMLTEAWAERLRGTGVVVNAMHPGWADTPGVASSLPAFYRAVGPLLRTPEQGADTIVWLAASRQTERETGKFWLDRAPHVTTVLPFTRQEASVRDALFASLQSMAARVQPPADTSPDPGRAPGPR